MNDVDDSVKTEQDSDAETVEAEAKVDDTVQGDVEEEGIAAETEEVAGADEGDIDDFDDEEDFIAMFEKSISGIETGKVVKGTVLQVTSEHVVVDIGYKSEGHIHVEEFYDIEKNVTVKKGDIVDVLLEDTEDDDGLVVLSKEKADQLKVWNKISDAYKEDAPIEGKIVQRVKGGLSVDIGIQAFLPGSQVDLRPIKNLDKLIGQMFDFKVLKFNRRRGNVVLSRRVLLEKEREKLRTDTLRTIADGQVVEGIVKNITDYGAFIDLGGIDGLLHITDMSWGRISHPSQIFEIGDKVKVMVLKFDRERERVSLGLKQTSPDPWTTAGDRYFIGHRVQGKVVSLTDYGAFVELEEGIEGLIHISEMSWTKKIRHPSQIVNVADIVETVVLNLDIENQRISLGLKQTETNPWVLIKETYPVGSVIKGKVRNITDFGIFIGIEEGIDGLVHISDLSWSQKVKHPGELFKKGDEVEAKVLNIDIDNERFSLGIKQLEKDPWVQIPQKYKSGDHVQGKVTNVTDFGIFVEFEPGIEGLIHISEVSQQKIKDIHMFAKVGENLTAEIISLDPAERKIGLSIKAFERSAEKADMDAFLAGQVSEQTTVLGDIFGKALSKAVDGAAAPAAEETTEDEPAAEEAEAEKTVEEPAAEEAEAEKTVEEPAAEEAEAEETVEESAAEETEEEVPEDSEEKKPE